MARWGKAGVGWVLGVAAWGAAWSMQVAPTHWLAGDAHPHGLVVDAQGQVFVSRYGSDSVVRISAAGEVKVLGSTGREPMGIALDLDGNVYTANFGSDTVTRITPGGQASTLAKTGRHPTGIVFSAARGELYVADSRSDTVTRIALDGRSSVLGRTGRRPMGIALDAQGNVYTADHLSNTVTRISPDGESRVWGSTGLRPFGIAVDARGHVYTANHGANTVTRITPSGVSSTLGHTGLHPFGLALDAQGNVYTTDHDAGTVSRISAEGHSQLWGATGSQPMGLAIDGAGRVYTANHGGHSVTRLELVRPPLAPQALRGESVGQSLTLRWQAPKDEGSAPVLDYLLEYRPVRQGPWRTLEKQASPATQVIVDGLLPGESLEWRVSALNWVGAGPAQGPVTVSTTGAAPPAVAPVSPDVPRPGRAVAASPPCPPLLTQQIRAGADNDASEVNRLVAFLDANEGEALPMDGSYDEEDVEAVKRFQLKYRAEILAPVGMARPTGLVSTMTREKINTMNCRRRTSP